MITAKELQALYDDYERLNGIYLAVFAELVEKAEEESERTDSYAASCEAYRVYNEARMARTIARNNEVYYGKKK